MRFIKMSIRGLLLLTLPSLCSFSSLWAGEFDASYSPKGAKWSLVSKCNSSGQDCVVTARAASQEAVEVANFPSPPAKMSQGEGLYRVSFSCGAGCSADYFFYPPASVAGPIAGVAAVDFTKRLAVVAYENPISIRQLFGPGKCDIHLAGASKRIVDSGEFQDARFVEGGRVEVEYLKAGALEKVNVPLCRDVR